jgi:tetratricopeptide (TPR) repeat protein
MFRDDPRSEQGTTATDPNLSTTAEGLPPETADTDASSLILAGGACGFLLSVPLGLMSSAPPGLAAVWLGLPVASLVVTMLWTWISNRSMPVLLPAVAALALLVNLSAAGAMGFAGVAGSLWLLLALWLAATERERPHRFPRLAAFGGAGVGLVIAIACHQSAYGPVLESRAALRAAHRDPKRAEEHFREAVLADPWAAEPRKQLAETLLTRWRQERSRSVWDEFEATLQEWLRRDPNSSSAWATAGSLYLDACAVTSSRTIREQAASAYRRAVELYPTSAAYRSTLAILLREMGNEEAFREQAAEALQLHENTPHADKKLDPKLADELRKGLSRSSPEQN